jgi:hypothetical protein
MGSTKKPPNMAFSSISTASILKKNKNNPEEEEEEEDVPPVLYGLDLELHLKVKKTVFEHTN